MNERNISRVVTSKSCTACGGCSVVCPQKCVKTCWNDEDGCYKTIINEDDCISCGKCRKVCPVLQWDNSEGNKLVGKCQSIYSAYATDEEHRVRSASGGFTTTFLKFLMKNGYIDCAVMAVRDEHQPIRSKMVIVNSYDEIDKTCGSVYSPITMNEIIDEIAQSNYEKVAIVGLPCHIESISHICRVNKRLGNKIKYKIALVCGHTPTANAYKYICSRLGMKAEEVTTLSNRGGGWPGYLVIGNKQKLVKIIYTHTLSWGMTLGSPVFKPEGCKRCADPTGYNADVSVCDAWLPKYKSDKKGRNLVLVRNTELEGIILDMKMQDVLALNEESLEDYIYANRNVFKEKLVINRIMTRRLGKYGLYANVKGLTANVPTLMFTRLLIASEYVWQVVGSNRRMNNAVLFYFKVMKYLSEKWAKIRNY